MVTKCKNEESIEEMVQRVERELDEEFRHLQLASGAERAAAADEVPKSRVPSELEELELENNNFNMVLRTWNSMSAPGNLVQVLRPVVRFTTVRFEPGCYPAARRVRGRERERGI